MSIRDQGTTIRASSSALLTIDSEDRYRSWAEKRASQYGDANFSPYNFTLIREAPLVNGYMTRLALTEVNFPWVYPNVNAKTSSINITWTTDPVGPLATAVVSLPIAFYTPFQLGFALVTAVNAVVNPAGTPGLDVLSSCIYGLNKLPRFTYETYPGWRIGFSPMTPNQQVTPAPGIPAVNVFPYSNTVKQLFDVLGFQQGVNSQLNTRDSGQATFAQAVRYIDIVSPQLTANQGLPDATSQNIGHNALCRLYISDATVPSVADPFNLAPPGTQPFIIYRQFTTPKEIAWNAIMPISGRISFQVYDDDGTLLDPIETVITPNPPGSSYLSEYIAYTDWSLSLLLTEN